MTLSRIATLEEIVRREPNDRTAHYMLGNEYFKAQMYIEEYTQALQDLE